MLSQVSTCSCFYTENRFLTQKFLLAKDFNSREIFSIYETYHAVKVNKVVMIDEQVFGLKDN